MDSFWNFIECTLWIESFLRFFNIFNIYQLSIECQKSEEKRLVEYQSEDINLQTY